MYQARFKPAKILKSSHSIDKNGRKRGRKKKPKSAFDHETDSTRIGERLSYRYNLPGCVFCVCILHIEPSRLPVDIQHNQCPGRFLNPREKKALWSYKYATEILHCFTVRKSRQRNAMSSYWIRQTRCTHPMTERKRKKHKQQIERNENKEEENVSCPPVGYVAGNTERAKENNTTTHERRETKNRGKQQTHRSTTKKKKRKAPSRQSQQFVARIA